MKKFLLVLALLAVSALPAGATTLQWDANTEPDLAGYKLHYGRTAGTYEFTIDVGNVLTYIINPPTDGTWYFAATAYDATGNESGYSNEVSAATTTFPPAAPRNLRVSP